MVPGHDSGVHASAIAAGFTVGGEGLAIDLVDTIKLAIEPPLDLLDGSERFANFWRIHEAQLPPGAGAPDRTGTLILRDAARAVLTAALDGTAPPAEAVATINDAAAASVPIPQLTDQGVRWHTIDGGHPALGAVAASIIETASRAASLRRCARPGCSMLFLASRRPRIWCSDSCGNRARVARYDARARVG